MPYKQHVNDIHYITAATVQEEGQEHMHDESVTSVGIELEGNLDMRHVNVWLSKLLSEQGVDLFRSKGILAIEGTDDKYAAVPYLDCIKS